MSEPLSLKPWSIIRNPLEAAPNHRNAALLSTKPLHTVHWGMKCMDRITKSNRGGGMACVQTGPLS